MPNMLILVHPNLVHESNPNNPEAYWSAVKQHVGKFDYVVVTLLTMNIPAHSHEKAKTDFIDWLKGQVSPTFGVVFENQTAEDLWMMPEFKKVFLSFLRDEKQAPKTLLFAGGTKNNCLETTKTELLDRVGRFLVTRNVDVKDYEPLIYDYPVRLEAVLFELQR